ncbi:MAG: HipA domain-containing protein [Bacteroidia bacterium]|nr:HipA domain-containing protein [Bacteroidia bacterium]
MNRCPISYFPCGENRYSKKGLKLLTSGLTNLKLLEYTAEEQRAEAFNRAVKMSIQGVQPKLSAILSTKDESFVIVEKGGRYILKPQHHLFREMPENEDLTMRLAELIDLEVPTHGLIWSKDESLTYFIKRFDRKGQNEKIPVEDFAQLAGLSRDTKYDYSMEKLVKLINRYCTFPAVENSKLFKLVLFNFLIGNDDMHLKNYSIINNSGKIELSPCYDLLNSTIEYKKEVEEIALPIKGKRKHLTHNILINYFGKGSCGLTEKVIGKILQTITDAVPDWRKLIDISFLSAEMKNKYHDLLNTRLDALKI